MSKPWLLAGGMLLGAAAAVFYMVRVPDTMAPTADAVAWVNARPIASESYESALRAVASDRKTGTLAEGDRERVLERLIDQELLIDRAIELGLHERDPQIRNTLATAMIDFLVRRAEDEARAADESELRHFYESERFRFERAPQLRVAVEGPAVPLPEGLLLEKEIAQRLGPSVARRLAELEVGESIVVGEGDAAYLVRLLERRGGEVAPFEEARPAVEAAYLRHRSEVAVREFLDVARKRSDVVVGPK
jgi:parvulin-like peptidyl-prolyl isomerase